MLDWASRASRQRSGVDRDKVVVVVLGAWCFVGKRLQGARAPGLLALFGSNWDSQNSAAAALQCDCAFLLVGSDARAAQGGHLCVVGQPQHHWTAPCLAPWGSPALEALEGSKYQSHSVPPLHASTQPCPSRREPVAEPTRSPPATNTGSTARNHGTSSAALSCLRGRRALAHLGRDSSNCFLSLCAPRVALFWLPWYGLCINGCNFISRYRTSYPRPRWDLDGHKPPSAQRDRAPASERPSSMQSDPAISFQLSPAAEPIDNGAIGEMQLDLDDTRHRSCCNWIKSLKPHNQSTEVESARRASSEDCPDPLLADTFRPLVPVTQRNLGEITLRSWWP